jgi:hypothetical protein
MLDLLTIALRRNAIGDEKMSLPPFCRHAVSK